MNSGVRVLAKKYEFALRIICSILLLSIVIGRVDVAELASRLGDVDLIFILPIFALLLANLVLMTAKWSVFLEGQGRPLTRLIGIYWGGDFVGLFSLGALGSEAYKAMSYENAGRALLASVLDRAFALGWAVEVGVVLFVFYSFGWNYLFAAPVIAVVFYLTVGDARRLRESRIAKLRFPEAVASRAGGLFLHAVFSTGAIVASATIIELAFHAAGWHVDFVVILMATPFLIVLLALPISVQGVGVRELVFLQIGQLGGVEPVYALLASLVSYLSSTIYRLVGGIPFVLTGRRNS